MSEEIKKKTLEERFLSWLVGKDDFTQSDLMAWTLHQIAKLCILGFIILHPLDAIILKWRDGRDWEKGTKFNLFCNCLAPLLLGIYLWVFTWLAVLFFDGMVSLTLRFIA